MTRPQLEVADIFRRFGPAWRAANAGHLPRGDQAGTGPTIRMTDKAGVATRGGRSPTGVTTLATARS